MNKFDLNRILDIGIALSTQRDHNKLFDTILNEAMYVTNSDAGTLYIYNEDEELLYFCVMRNNTMKTYEGGDGGKVNLPPVKLKEANVCAFSAIHRKLVNIEDVYNSSEFDFSGPRNYDSITKYKTTSMLVVPLENNAGELNGVLQLINAMDEDGKVIAFDPSTENVVRSLASQAAIALTNLDYTVEIKNLLSSVVEVLAAAIDERSPYNANHTRNVAKYADFLVNYTNEMQDEKGLLPIMNKNDQEQLIMAAWLHDVGKLVIPLEVMDKSTRLEARIYDISKRFEKINLLSRIDFLEGKISKKENEDIISSTAESLKLIENANSAGFLDENARNNILEISKRTYTDVAGEICPWLTEDELYNLSIIKGTLTKEERETIESHATITEKLLSKIKFNKHYNKVTKWAAGHHECVNGKGYPYGLSGEEIDLQMRILAVLDVFDALTAKDRPYKKAMPIDKTLDILYDMAKGGALDESVVDMLKDSQIWEKEL